MKQSPFVPVSEPVAHKSTPNPFQTAALQKKEDPFFTSNPQNAFFQKKAVPSASSAVVQAKTAQTTTKTADKTGLPNNLKSGIEHLSDMPMDDVKVHYNSDKPHQINALAFAQGTDIHLAAGQEKHLAHEAWHVVQQKQGRVQPTTQMPKNVYVNDDNGLENEADTMGAQAMQMDSATLDKTQNKASSNAMRGVSATQHNAPVVQRIKVPNLKETIELSSWMWQTGASNESQQVLTATFQNTLILLKMSLKSFMPKPTEQTEHNKLLLEVDVFSTHLIGTPTDTTKLIDELDTLINKVNALTASAPQLEGSKLRTLDNAEKVQFDQLIDTTVALVGTTRGTRPVLKQTFGSTAETDVEQEQAADTAHTNLGKIAAHLQFWKTNSKTKVQLNTANAGFGGFNQNTGDASLLTINKDGLVGTPETPFTLIHEASHGAKDVETRDLGYMGNSYFFNMPSKFRLKNADHYAFAAHAAKGTRTFPAAVIGGAIVPIALTDDEVLTDKFAKAKSLAYFKAEKIWLYLMWAKDTYLNKQTYMPQPGLDAYANSMGLPGRKETKIQSTHVLVSLDVYNGMQYHLKKDMTFTYDAVKRDMTITREDTKQRIARDVTPAMSIDDMSTAILDAMTQGYELPQGWSIHKEGLMLFDQLFRQQLHLSDGNKPQPIETELYNWLKT